MDREWINQMFEQVSVNLHHLLDSLTFIYQSHGVEYTIRQYYDTLMRLLAPIQLLSPSNSGNQATNSNYVHKSKRNQQKFNNNYQRNESFRDQLQARGQCNMKKYEKEREHKQSIKIQDDRMQKKYKQRPVKSTLYQMELDEKRKQGFGRTTLTYDQQLQLANWIKNQFQKGYQVKSQQIAKKAKIIAKNKMFQASSGWLRRFLNRNPPLKLLLQKDKFMPNLMQIKEEINIYSQKLNKRNETWDEIYNSEYPMSEISEECPQFEEIKEIQQNKKNDGSEQEKNSQKSLKKSDKEKSVQLSQAILKLQGAVKNHQSNYQNSNYKIKKGQE